MRFHVQLFLREHHNGFFTLGVLSEPSLQIYTEGLDAAREELELLLSDRFERLHPNALGRYANAGGLEHHELEIPDILEVEEHDGPAPEPTRISVLVAHERRWQRLWIPRWNLRYWIPRDAELEEALFPFLQKHASKLSPHKRLRLRAEGREWTETLEVEAEPAPATAFTGKLLGAKILPVPRARDEEDEDREDDEDDDEEDEAPRSGKQKKNKKKRPPTPTLKKIGLNLTALAKDEELERAHGRKREVDDLLNMIAAPGNTVFVVLGEPGVGKTTLLNELVYRIRKKQAPGALSGRRVWFADASRLIAGDGWITVVFSGELGDMSGLEKKSVGGLEAYVTRNGKGWMLPMTSPPRAPPSSCRRSSSRLSPKPEARAPSTRLPPSPSSTRACRAPARACFSPPSTSPPPPSPRPSPTCWASCSANGWATTKPPTRSLCS